MIDTSSLFNDLSSCSSVRRHDALLQIRVSLRSSRIDVCSYQRELLPLLRSCLDDAHWSVVHQSLQLLSDIGTSVMSWGTQLVPCLIACLAHEKAAVRRATLGVLSGLAAKDIHSNTKAFSVVESVVQIGFGHKNKKIRCEAMLCVSKLTGKTIHEPHLLTVLESMVSNLSDPDHDIVRAAQTALAFVWHRFQSQVPTALKQLRLETLRELRQNMPQVRQVAAEVTSHRKENVSFGCIPQHLLISARNIDYRVRIDAIEAIHQHINNVDDWNELQPHLGEFIEFLGDSLNDSNFKYQMTVLNIAGSLVTSIEPTLLVIHIKTLLPKLIHNFGDNKIAVRQVNRALFVQLLDYMPNTQLVPFLQTALSHVNANTRETALELFVYALLQKSEATSCTTILNSLNGVESATCQLYIALFQCSADAELKIQVLALEALALIANTLGVEYILKAARNSSEHSRLQERLKLEHLATRVKSPDSSSLVHIPLVATQVKPIECSAVLNRVAHTVSSNITNMQREGNCAIENDENRGKRLSVTRRHSSTSGSDSKEKFGNLVADNKMDSYASQEFTSTISRHSTACISSRCAPEADVMASKLKNLKSKAIRGRSPGRRAYSAQVSRTSYPLAITGVETEVPLSQLPLSNTAYLFEQQSTKRTMSSGGVKNQKCRSDMMIYGTSTTEEQVCSTGPYSGPQETMDLSMTYSGHTPSIAKSATIYNDMSLYEQHLINQQLMTSTIRVGEGGRVSRASRSAGMRPLQKQKSALPNDVISRRLEGVSTANKYVPSADLKPFENAELNLESMLTSLSSPSWKEQFSALDSLRRLCRYHSHLIVPQIVRIVATLRAPLHSLRSSLVRNALLSVKDLFENCGATMEKASVKSLAPALLRHSCGTNEFLKAEASSALSALATNVSAKVAVLVMLDHASKSPLERAQILLVVEKAVAATSGVRNASLPSSLGTIQFSRLIKLVAQRLEEGSIAVRNAAKKLSASLEMISGHLFWSTAQSTLSSRIFGILRDAVAKTAMTASHSDELSSRAYAKISMSPSSLACGATGHRQLSHTREEQDLLEASDSIDKAAFDVTQMNSFDPHHDAMFQNSNYNAQPVKSGNEHFRSNTLISTNGRKPPCHNSEKMISHTLFSLPKAVMTCLHSSEWRQRLDGIERLRDIVCNRKRELSADELQVTVECIAPRLTDSNIKVNVAAMRVLQNMLTSNQSAKMREALVRYVCPLNDGFSVIVPALGVCLASRDTALRRLASETINIIERVSDRNQTDALIANLSRVASLQNVRVKTVVLSKLATLIESGNNCSSSTYADISVTSLYKYVIPLAFSNIDTRNNDVLNANKRLLHSLHHRLGSSLVNVAEGESMGETAVSLSSSLVVSSMKNSSVSLPDSRNADGALVMSSEKFDKLRAILASP